MAMAEDIGSNTVLNALLSWLSSQGQGGDRGHLTAYPIKGTIDLVALAEAVESALGGDTSDEDDAKTPAELNAANDG